MAAKRTLSDGRRSTVTGKGAWLVAIWTIYTLLLVPTSPAGETSAVQANSNPVSVQPPIQTGEVLLLEEVPSSATTGSGTVTEASVLLHSKQQRVPTGPPPLLPLGLKVPIPTRAAPRFDAALQQVGYERENISDVPAPPEWPNAGPMLGMPTVAPGPMPMPLPSVAPPLEFEASRSNGAAPTTGLRNVQVQEPTIDPVPQPTLEPPPTIEPMPPVAPPMPETAPPSTAEPPPAAEQPTTPAQPPGQQSGPNLDLDIDTGRDSRSDTDSLTDSLQTPPQQDTAPAAPTPAPEPAATTETAASDIASGGLGESQTLGGTEAAAVNTTAEALSQSASVNVRRTSSINLDPRVRGFVSNQLNASANGATLIKARIDIDSLFSQIDPGIVSRLDVIDGPYTSLYGTGFAFLIAELVEMPRSEEEDTVLLESATSFSYSTNGQGLYARELIKAGGNRWGAVATYGLRIGNDYQPGGRSDDFRVPTSYQRWDSYTAFSYDLDPRSRVELSYLRAEYNDVELPGVIYDITNSKEELFNVRYIYQPERNGPRRAVIQYWWGLTAYAASSERSSKQRTFYDPFITQSFNGYTGKFAPFNLANTFGDGTSLSTGARSYIVFGDNDGILLTVGADWRRLVQEYRETHVDSTGNADTIIFGTLPFGIPKSSLDDYGIFFDMTIPTSNEMFTLGIGGRLDRTYNFVAEDDINAGSNFQAGRNQPKELLTMLYLTGNLRVTEELTLRSGAAYAMRNPALGNLYSDSPFVPLVRVGNAIVVGNSSLDPERNLQFDLGLGGDYEDFDFEIKGFASTIYDYILYEPTGLIGRVRFTEDPVFQPVEYTYRNLTRASLYGVSGTAEYFLGEYFSVNARLAYLRGINHSPREFAEDPESGLAVQRDKGAEGLPGLAPLRFALGLRMSPRDDPWWAFEFITRAVDGQDVVADSLRELTTPGFTVFDLRAFVKVNDSLTLSSSVENLFDRTYTEHGSLVIIDRLGNPSFVKEPGFNFRFAMQYEY